MFQPDRGDSAHSKFSSHFPLVSLDIVKEEDCRSAMADDSDRTRFVDIEDDKTPVPESTINSVRRSESSDEDEPIIKITSPTSSDDIDDGQKTQVLRF